MLRDLELWLTPTHSVAPAKTTIYVALNCSCTELPIVDQCRMHIKTGSWELQEGAINLGYLLRTLNATLFRFTHGVTHMETRHGFNWSVDPAHWSHFARVQGFDFRVQGSGLRVWGSGLRV